jgi:hypothetical protein
MTLRQTGRLTASHNMTTLTLVVSCCSYKLVAEAGEISGTWRRGNVDCWKPLPCSEDVTVDTSMCIIVNCSYTLYQTVQQIHSSIQNPVCSHTVT